MKRVLDWLERHPKVIRCVLVLIVGGLTCKLFWPMFDNHIEPFLYQSLMHQSGKLGLTYLILTLSMTPLRRWLTIFCKFYILSYGKRLSDWNFLIRHRRNLGLSAAYFSLLHTVFYVWLNMDFLFDEIWWDVTSRPFISIGWVAFFIMFVLAVTSPKKMQRTLKKKWRTIHKSIYFLCLLILIHFAFSLKPEQYDYFLYAAVIGLLLLHRIYFKLKKDKMNRFDDGMEARR